MIVFVFRGFVCFFRQYRLIASVLSYLYVILVFGNVRVVQVVRYFKCLLISGDMFRCCLCSVPESSRDISFASIKYVFDVYFILRYTNVGHFDRVLFSLIRPLFR